MKMIDKSDFTHYASFYGVPCYWNERTSALSGRNIAFDYLLIAATHIHNFMALCTSVIPGYENPGFPLKLKGEIKIMIEISKLQPKDIGRRVEWFDSYQRFGELQSWDSTKLIVAEDLYGKKSRRVYVDPEKANFADA